MKINPKLIVKNIAGETVIIPTGNVIKNFNGMISTNETAGFIWEHIQECDTPEDMVKLVRDAFEIDEETAKEDVLGFLTTLKEVGMIQF